MGVHWKDWCWSWNSNTLATSCEELTHWKRPWCWEGLGAGGEGNNRGWDGWMASPTQWTWVCVNSRSWWWTGRPGVLWFMGLQRVRHDWATELNWGDRGLDRWPGRQGKPWTLGWNFGFNRWAAQIPENDPTWLNIHTCDLFFLLSASGYEVVLISREIQEAKWPDPRSHSKWCCLDSTLGWCESWARYLGETNGACLSEGCSSQGMTFWQKVVVGVGAVSSIPSEVRAEYTGEHEEMETEANPASQISFPNHMYIALCLACPWLYMAL